MRNESLLKYPQLSIARCIDATYNDPENKTMNE